MARIVIVGDGPGGLSAALFLAKNDQVVSVFGQDTTDLHYAFLNNYLGVPETAGSDFQQTARAQVMSFGAKIIDEKAVAVSSNGDRFDVQSDAAVYTADYLILTEGKDPALARSLGVVADPDGTIGVDRNGRTSLGRVYVVGRSARPDRSQAIISAGDGAAAALDILSDIAGKDVHDWDSTPTG